MRNFDIFGEYMNLSFGQVRHFTPAQRARKHWGNAHHLARVVPEWHVFETFVDDMGLPLESAVLVRRDRRKPYGPGNCYWDYPKGQ